MTQHTHEEVQALAETSSFDLAREVLRLRNCISAREEWKRGSQLGKTHAASDIEQLRADAERYRWLRDHGVTYVICRYEKGGDVEHDWCGWLPLDTRETDAAIDAAMKEEK